MLALIQKYQMVKNSIALFELPLFQQFSVICFNSFAVLKMTKSLKKADFENCFYAKQLKNKVKNRDKKHGGKIGIWIAIAKVI